MGKQFTAKTRPRDRLANLRAKRDELATLIDREPAGPKKEAGQMKLAEIDRRIAKLDKKKVIPPFVLAAVLQLILAALQWWLSSFVYSPSPRLLSL